MPDTTEMAAAGFARGAKPYQQRARTALPILVRQAKAHQTMYYGELAHEMGIPNPRTLNYPLGSIGGALLDLGKQWSRQVPPIQALVINKSSECPGEGFAFFAPDAKAFERATRRERRLIVDTMLRDVFTFSDWDQVLDTFALPPAPVVGLPPADEISAHGGGGEGAEHKRLKEAVSVNPLWIGLPNSLSPGKVEARLHSGDSLDVLFADSDRRTAVEVKGASAPVGEVIRGLFQCVKYEAVLDAEARVAGSRADCEAVLALGGSFPGELTPLRHTLGVKVFENLGPRAGAPETAGSGTATSARGHAAGSTLAFPTTRFRASSVACGDRSIGPTRFAGRWASR